MAQMFGITNT